MRTIDLPDLDLEETVEAIRQGQLKKYFHVKHAPYWQEQHRLAEEKHEEEKSLNRPKRQASSGSQARTPEADCP